MEYQRRDLSSAAIGTTAPPRKWIARRAGTRLPRTARSNGRTKHSVPSGHRPPSGDGTVYVASVDHNLYAIREGVPVDGAGNCATVPLLTRDGTVYRIERSKAHAVSYDGKSAPGSGAGRDQLVARARAAAFHLRGSNIARLAIRPDGRIAGRFMTEDRLPSPAIALDGTVYFAAPTGSRAPDDQRREAGDERHPSSPALGADGAVYVGSEDSHLYAFNADGSPRWAFNAGASVNSSPALAADGTLYVGTSDGTLFAVDGGGHQVWSFKTDKGIEASPAIGPSGEIVVGSRDGTIYEFR
jgi:outer membrane protein assembly factor BamB